MFANFVKNILSFNSPNDFERAISQVTNVSDSNPPPGKDLQNVLLAFSGKNPEIRGNAAFYLIIAKLQASKSRKHWNYLMKNLVILDKAIDTNYFAKEISELELPEIDDYASTNDKKGIGPLIKRYFRYIKAKGRLYNTKKLPLTLAFEKKKECLDILEKDILLAETKRIKSLVILALDIFVTGSKENLSFKLNQYVFFLILNTLINALSIQYMISVIIIASLSELTSDFILEFYHTFKDLLKDIELLHQQCERLAFIPGFKLSKDQICDLETGQKVIKSIEEYIEVLSQAGPDLTARLRQKSLYVQQYNMKIKCSDINLAPILEVFHTKPKGDDIEVESEDNLEDDDDFLEMSCDATSPYMSSPDRFTHTQSSPDKSSPDKYNSYLSSPTRAESNRLPSPRKTHTTKVFRESFNVGFRSLVATDCEEGELPTNYIQGNLRLKTMSRSNYFAINAVKVPKDPNAENLTSIFHQLLALEEQDSVFDSFKNFYSEEYLNKFEEQYEKNGRKENGKILNRLKTHGHLPVNLDLDNLEYEVPIVQDFDPEIFLFFKNTYSKE